jgi:hypothetical protein
LHRVLLDFLHNAESLVTLHRDSARRPLDGNVRGHHGTHGRPCQPWESRTATPARLFHIADRWPVFSVACPVWQRFDHRPGRKHASEAQSVFRDSVDTPCLEPENRRGGPGKTFDTEGIGPASHVERLHRSRPASW